MAVDALQLRPRTPLALYDAALRAAASSSALWLLTLPASTALVLAFFTSVEAARRHEPMLLPAIALTAAFVLRCLTQGAASHHLEQTILQHEPALGRSVVAALKRLPSLIVAGTIQLLIDGALGFLTLGIGFFFAGAHQAIFPTAMRGEGSALSLYQTSSRLLGAARATAPFVRFLNGVQLVLAINLFVSTTVITLLGQQLLALDLTFVQRFTSIDNGVWVATVLILTFAAFEPVRVAVGVLLLIDGRVRQEGLDLVAQTEQLPRRKKTRGPIIAVSTLLLAWSAFADEPTAIRQRVERVIEECEMGERVDTKSVRGIDGLPERDHAALTRFVSRVERVAYDDQDCDAAEDDLRGGLTELTAAREFEKADAAERARHDAASILSRPEFQTTPTRKPEPEKPEPVAPEPTSAFRKWLEKLLKRFFDWLNERDPAAPQVPEARTSSAMTGANLVLGVIVVGLVALLVFLALQLRRKPGPSEADGEAGAFGETGLVTDPMSALAKRPETWAGLADQLAEQGNYREAIRHLYLALLSRLHRRGFIDYDPTASNWDYLFAFKGPGDAKQSFRELTRRFDFTWYGNFDATDVSYRGFRALVQPLLSQGDEEPARA